MNIPESRTIAAAPQAGGATQVAPEAPDEPDLGAQGRLKSESVRGIFVNVGAEGGKFVLRFAYQIIMVRLLLPADFGLVAMAAPAIAFV
ncbi:MAG TPA: hypothetical protein VME47_00855, partial [Acetobacteraceae bacterium]|nr:hypothetical protein [Acetobacteraceae bacterium]